MQIVGVDFGTTNIRISTWDSERDLPPNPQPIGVEGTTTMPAVVALHRESGGAITIIVGEDADGLQDDPNETLVIRNFKRNALSSDAYVGWHLEARNSQQQEAKWPPQWWNPDRSCVQAWGQEYPVWDLIHELLAEAFRRADVAGEFEWRAGCPVHAGYEYRKGLAETLGRLSGSGELNWVTEEPILFLTMARELGNLEEGSYLVYDVGGGSFDCALVEINRNEMLVYGADGHPLLGGADIDEHLRQKLEYTGQLNLLRQAKERLSPSNPSQTLGDGTIISEDSVNATLVELGFLWKSLSTIRDSYISAKTLWKRPRGEADPPVGEVISRNPSGAIRHVWQLSLNDLTHDIDGIILIGGPTNSSYFRNRLSDKFGQDKILTPSEVLPTLIATPDLELVGVSMGACYSYRGTYSPLYVNRLPASVSLENLETGDAVKYKAFQSFASRFKPFSPFISEPLRLRQSIVRSLKYPKSLQLTIVFPNGVVTNQAFIDNELNERQIGSELKLVIDRFGVVGVRQESEQHRPKVVPIFDQPPWQTGDQKAAFQRLLEQQRENEHEMERRGLINVTRHPWDYPTP